MESIESDGEVRTLKSRDGYPIRYRAWEVASPRAAVVVLHGIQSHGGWYLDSCAYLARKGYTVFAPDRRGSGLNRRDRGDVRNRGVWFEDLDLFADLVEEACPGKKLFWIGISWGGKLAPAYFVERGRGDGLVLVTPGIRAVVNLSLSERMLLAACLPFSPRRLFPVPIPGPDSFTRDPARRAFIRDDPLLLRRATARFLFQSFLLDRLLKRGATALTLPVLLLLAGRDRIVDNAGILRYVESLPSADKTVRVYPEAVHTLEFEPEREAVFREISSWLEERA